MRNARGRVDQLTVREIADLMVGYAAVVERGSRLVRGRQVDPGGGVDGRMQDVLRKGMMGMVVGLLLLVGCGKVEEEKPACPYSVVDRGWYYEIEVWSDADSVESCFWDEYREVWACKRVLRQYYGCWRMMKEVWDVRIRIDGCETVLDGYE